jgi:hypothetical protein
LESQYGQEIFAFSLPLLPKRRADGKPRPALGPTQPPILWAQRAFLKTKRSQSMKVTTQLHLAPRLKRSGAIHLLPLHAFMLWRGKFFTGEQQTYYAFGAVSNGLFRNVQKISWISSYEMYSFHCHSTSI